MQNSSFSGISSNFFDVYLACPDIGLLNYSIRAGLTSMTILAFAYFEQFFIFIFEGSFSGLIFMIG